ncbi:hypothetical protein ACQ4PT_020687 [Festuca glaucescens]
MAKSGASMDADDGTVLGRLPDRRALGICRSVCRAWRDMVDDNKLRLLSYVFQRDFPGVFTNSYNCEEHSHFFAKPPSSRRPSTQFRRPPLWHGWAMVANHCNGLLLLQDYELPFESPESDTYVCNPATMRYAALPRPPGWAPPYDDEIIPFLAFDPTVSLHYEVFLFNETTMNLVDRPMPLLVFSSRTGRWEDREFLLRQCVPEKFVTTTAPFRNTENWRGEYWRGSLYLYSQKEAVIVLRCSEGTYDVVQLPGEPPSGDGDFADDLPQRSLLASYDGGVRYAVIDEFQLHVWALTERLEWVLAREANLNPHAHTITSQFQRWRIKPRVVWEVPGSTNELLSLFKGCGDSDTEEAWNNDHQEAEEFQGFGYSWGDFVRDMENGLDYSWDSHHQDNLVQDTTEDIDECSERSWDSDEDNFIDVDESLPETPQLGWCHIAGLHPHKDVLLDLCGTLVAYHLRTSGLQYLGSRPFSRECDYNFGISRAYPYRPCYVDVLPAEKIPHPTSFDEPDWF